MKHNTVTCMIQCLWPRGGLRTQGTRSLRRDTLDLLDDRKVEPVLLESLHEQGPGVIRAPHAAAERQEQARKTTPATATRGFEQPGCPFSPLTTRIERATRRSCTTDTATDTPEQTRKNGGKKKRREAARSRKVQPVLVEDGEEPATGKQVGSASLRASQPPGGNQCALEKVVDVHL